MNVFYEMAVVAKCPKGGRDEYKMIVSADEVIEVEALIQIVEDCTKRPIFQETLCQDIANNLEEIGPASARVSPPAGKVRLEGVHSGVRVTCEEEFGEE